MAYAKGLATFYASSKDRYALAKEYLSIQERLPLLKENLECAFREYYPEEYARACALAREKGWGLELTVAPDGAVVAEFYKRTLFGRKKLVRRDEVSFENLTNRICREIR